MIFLRRRPEYDPDKEMTLRLRWRIWTSGWRGAGVLLLLIVAGLMWWKGDDAYRWIKVRRAEQLIAQSEAARARGDHVEASKKLGQATALLGRHPVTLRAVARYQVEMHDLSALNTYVELMKTGFATTADQIMFVRESFRMGRPEMSAPVLSNLREQPHTREFSAVLALQAEQSAIHDNWQEAMKFARQAVAATGDDAELAYARFVLARLLLQPPSPILDDGPVLIREGVALLGALAQRPDTTGLEALETLVNLSQNPQTAPLFLHLDVAALIEAAERHPRADAALRVGAWSLRMAAEPDKHDEITQKLFEHFKNHPSSTLRLETARWLRQRGKPRLALDLAEPSKFESEDWFVLYLDATAALGDWEKVLVTLTARDQPVLLPPALRKLFELRGALETGRKPDLVAAWRDIQAAVRTETARNQLYVAGYAEQIGFRDEAVLIYRRLLDAKIPAVQSAGGLGHPSRLACYTGILRNAASKMSLDELRNLCVAFAEEFPEIDEVQNDCAYLQLLSGMDIESAGAVGEKLMQKKPELLAYRTTMALSLLRQQKPDAAAAIYEGWNINWNSAQDRYKAVYVAVLRAAGRAAEAEKMAAEIKPDKLREEERKLAGLP